MISYQKKKIDPFLSMCGWNNYNMTHIIQMDSVLREENVVFSQTIINAKRV